MFSLLRMFSIITEKTLTVLDYLSNTTDIIYYKKLGLLTLSEDMASHPVFS